MKNKFIRQRFFLLFCTLCCAITTYAQSETQLIREGNKLFRAKKYLQAEIAFRKALDKNNRNSITHYNLGCALQAQKKTKEAMNEYKSSTSLNQNSLYKSKAYYNTGTILQQQKKYEEAIKAYKNALRNNPNHTNARYNLELCKQQQNKQQQNKQQQNSKNKQDRKKHQNKNKTDKKNSNKNEQKQDEGMSRNAAERLLDMAIQQEKNTQERLSKAMHQPSGHKLEKNW